MCETKATKSRNKFVVLARRIDDSSPWSVSFRCCLSVQRYSALVRFTAEYTDGGGSRSIKRHHVETTKPVSAGRIIGRRKARSPNRQLSAVAANYDDIDEGAMTVNLSENWLHSGASSLAK